MKVINLEDKMQVQVHKNKLNDKIQKLQREKEELDKLEKDKLEKDKQAQVLEAKKAIKKYPRFKMSTFRNEEEAYQMIAFNEGLRNHFTKTYHFVKDVIIGWLDSDIDDRSISMRIGTKTVPVKNFIRMIGIINGSYMNPIVTELYKKYQFFERRNPDSMIIEKKPTGTWIKFWWD